MSSPLRPRRPQAPEGTPRAWYEPAIDRGLLPDWLLRRGIRAQLRARLRLLERGGSPRQRILRNRTMVALRRGPIADHTAAANRQHYEVPPEFFELVLGPRRKYSCCWWEGGIESLADAEEGMLEITARHAGLADGQRVLDLGCGWGSLSLWLAGRFRRAEIHAVSNSVAQIAHIRARAGALGLANVHARHADINDFEPDGRFHRVVSVEMFEHVGNWEALLDRTTGWLRPGGRLFVHHFAHRRHVYPFAAERRDEWMARHFFTGGVMPSADLLSRFPYHARVLSRRMIDGRHYQKTCEAWLANLDRHRDAALRQLARVHGDRQARAWLHRWRVFFMACAELFGYREGGEWLVVHALLEPESRAGRNGRSLDADDRRRSLRRIGTGPKLVATRASPRPVLEREGPTPDPAGARSGRRNPSEPHDELPGRRRRST